MKEYRVFIDITISTDIEVKANDEQEARSLALEKYYNHPHYYETIGGIADVGVVDIYEIEE